MAASKTLLTLATLLVLATSQAHGLSIGGVGITSMVVNVGLHNQANPAGPVVGNAAPLTNIPVNLMLHNQEIASANTDVNGNALLTVNSPSVLSSITTARDVVNEGLFVYAFSVAVTYQGPVQMVNIDGTALHLTVTNMHVVT